MSAIAAALVIAMACWCLAGSRDNAQEPSAGIEEACENSRMIGELQESVDQLEMRVNQALNQQYYHVSTAVYAVYIPVEVTAYNPTECQTDSTPYLTASNKIVRPGIVALSRDLEEDFGFTFGDTVILDGIGSFIFEDRMNARWRRRVDILMSSWEDARKFGRKDSYLIISSACNVL
jgi:3D (Asp-Asp-Asp) domain-containing protein